MSDSSTDDSSPVNSSSRKSSKSISRSRSRSPIPEKESKKRKKEKSKKEKKNKKDKKSHKREKRSKKEKKSSKKDKRGQDGPLCVPALSAEEQREVDDFKRAVQGPSSSLRNRQNSDDISRPLDISGLTKEQLAESLGLSKGLLRTSEQDYSITQRYASSIFGGCQDDNPAKRQRMKRELTAQRAIEKANAVIAANRAAAAGGSNGVEINYASADRFMSSDRRR